MVMAGNPFLKRLYVNLRDWEEELVFFCVEQLTRPDSNAWQALVVDEESRHVAGFVAHQLANFAFVRRLDGESELRATAAALRGKPVSWEDFSGWLDEKWLDQSRFFATLETALKAGARRETHALTI
jgi:hypothetical protein